MLNNSRFKLQIADENFIVKKLINCIAYLVTAAWKILKIILNSASPNDEELLKIIDTIEQTCDVCLKKKKAKVKPLVGLALSKDFNDIIALDLKVIDVLHIVEYATRFSAATVVSLKKKEGIAKAIIRNWIAILVHQVLFFQIMVFQELDELFYIAVKLTLNHHV